MRQTEFLVYYKFQSKEGIWQGFADSSAGAVSKAMKAAGCNVRNDDQYDAWETEGIAVLKD